MRSDKTMARPVLVALALASAMTFGSAALASERDRVYADSFGNLVIESAAGAKRIVVGQGHQAKAVASFTDADLPQVTYADEAARSRVDCYRRPWLIKGRSYMYGFDQGEIPFQGGPCR